LLQHAEENNQMKRNILNIIRILIFWMMLFFIQRTVFIIYNLPDLKDPGFGLIMKSYWCALGMDISSSCYLFFIPLFIAIIASFCSKNKILIKIINIYNLVMIIFCSLISIFDIGLYSVWGSKINSKAISYMLYPQEAIQSFSSVPYILLLTIVALEIFLFIFIYRKWIRIKQIDKIRPFPAIVFFLVAVFLLFTGIRGGFQKYPMNKGWVYYSKYPVLNYAALNGFWNLVEIFVNPGIKENPYKYFTDEKADEIVASMYAIEKDSTEKILNTERPNIVLILLESVSAECSKTLGGTEDLMPGFDSLCSEGLLFNNFYATGFRTEQGLISFLSCFPAQPRTTIMRQFGKFEKLPSFARMLDEHKYYLNYYYSGNLEFANTGPYLASSGFSKIIGRDDHEWIHTTQWGAYDEEMFSYHLSEAVNDSIPFFSIIMTSTNHEPFEAKVEKVYKGGSEGDRYRNSVIYTDKCLSEYLRKAKGTSWYKNTLFIISADHAHSYPNNRKANEVERHRIPLLFYGDVLKDEYKGVLTKNIGSQTDLAATLLSQLGIDSRTLKRSINLLNKYAPQFAFYTFDNGFGIITPGQSLVYDHDLGQIVYEKNQADSLVNENILNEGKAYLQQMFREYIELNQ
jgi:phosphoglycerol transferase MdoB-like AlkP superfamily enzyme